MTTPDSDPSRHETVCVGLGARAYDIHIGPMLLERAGAFLSPLLKRPRVFIISDEMVFAAQGARLLEGLKAGAIEHTELVLEPGEAAKRFSVLEDVLTHLLDSGVDRGDLIIAFGGGVIGDLAGFAAAILRRGCRFAQIPTSLLAQVDSAVGGKTGINAPQGKNLIGAFHQPCLVLADIGALQSLSARQRRAGYAEIVKYAALGDTAFFDWLEQRGDGVLTGDVAAQAHAVKVSVTHKAAIVEADERECGVRALLNLGHTFGHALEAATGFSNRLLHGEAVAVGMGLAASFSAEIGFCGEETPRRLKAHLRQVGLPAGLDDLRPLGPFDAGELVAFMRQDKKVEGGVLSLILLRRVGEAFIEKAPDMNRLHQFLERQAALADRGEAS